MKFHRTFWVFLLLFLSATSGFAQEKNPHQALAKAKQQALTRSRQLEKTISPVIYGNYDVHLYDLDLMFHPESESISGIVEIGAISGLFQESILVDLATNMNIDSVVGRNSGFSRSGGQVLVEFDDPLESGEDFRIRIAYHGEPEAAGFQGLTFEEHSGGPIYSSLSEPYFARTWWPCKDVPVDKADSVNIHITTGRDVTPISNGSLAEITYPTDSTHTWHWEVRYPITTYLISVAISNYDHLTDTYVTTDGDSMPLDYYLYSQETTSDYITGNVAETKQMLESFARMFGEYPFLKEKYGMASFNWGGAMEHQTISSMGSYSRSIIAHELAHQWWGNMVTTRTWNHIWLNEGFASYSEALYFEETEGTEQYHEYMRSMAYRGQGTVYVHDTTSVSRIFNGSLTYDKAGYILHMLRHVVGDSTFFDVLDEYREQYYMKTAITEDFRRVAEQVSGRDLSAFFQQWIYEPGAPNYDYCMWTNPAGGQTEVILSINQTQMEPFPEVFEMPLDVRFSDSTGHDTTLVVENFQRKQQYNFIFDWQPNEVKLDPDDWVLKTAKHVPANLTRDGCEFLEQFAIAPAYPNPFNNETTLTFTLPTRAYVNGDIIDITGRKVASIVSRVLDPDRHTYHWDGTDDQGAIVSSGIYFFRIRAGENVTSQKMIFLK
ncbi:MAG: T9SS type A sorting domain-containing protein [Candidatus Marinimicrobia bacterium]|nr:T9SS type A sorting domain-containing protein [Candidatus Neomarinimicrobiota bacterium]MCF7829986.1 T9SS type A sorting domain-containing protein [Candidatus Neomarinimicrobiota bacterium]MCF7881860.1 T9SS type A sorting domain-containing protein [Candidatus Neomarinimicrobiota bacterium]